MHKHHYFIYIFTNNYRTTLSMGVTDNVTRRIEEHKSGTLEGFTKKYNTTILVYYEEYQYIDRAIASCLVPRPRNDTRLRHSQEATKLGVANEEPRIDNTTAYQRAGSFLVLPYRHNFRLEGSNKVH